MDKDSAERMAYISRSCAGLLRHTVWLVKQQGTEEEFVDYKEAMGRVFAELQTRILDPLYAEHPELDPKSPTYSGSYGERMMESYLQEDEGPRDDTAGHTKSSSSGAPPPAEAAGTPEERGEPAPDNPKA